MPARRLRSGVAEIVSVTVLILIAVAIGVGFYYTAKSLIDEGTRKITESISRAELRLNDYVVVDAFYISSNNTLVIYLYTSTDGSVILDRLYVDNSLVPPSNYVYGFNKPLKAGEIHRFAAQVTLTPGRTYEILLTGPSGVKVEATIHIG